MFEYNKSKARIKASFEDENLGPKVWHSWGAVAGAAIGVVGGALSSRSANKAGQIQSDAANYAADKQLQASREANQLTADMYRSGLAQQAPYQQGGQLALSSLMGGFGLGPAQSSVRTPAQMTGGGVAPIGSFVDAQGRAVDAKGNPIQAGSGVADVNYGATQEELDKAAGIVPAGYFTKNFGMEDFYNNVDPGYQFRMDQGNAALAAKRAAVGNRFGGQALKDISNYNQDLASQEYQSAFDRYNLNKANLFDRLSQLSGTGSAAGGAAATLGGNAADSMGRNTMEGQRIAGDYTTGGAAARAGGLVGSTNAIVNGVNQGANNWYTYRTMGNLNNNNNPNSNIWNPTYDDTNAQWGGWTGGH